MSEHLPPTGRDEFDDIVLGARTELEGLIAYNDRDGYYGILLKDDLARLRSSFSGYVKDCYRQEPGFEMRDEEYELVAYLMNRTDLPACPELRAGDTISSTSAIVAFTQHFRQDGPAEAEILSAEDSLVGTFHSIAVIPVPQLGEISDEGINVDGRSLEPVLVIEKPVIEDSSGEMHDSHMTLAFVPFLDKDVRFVKRVYQERGL